MRPVHCARCNDGTAAAWLVTTPSRSTVVCERHLAAAKEWVGPAAVVEAVDQPDGVAGAVQEGLFEMPGGDGD